MFSLGAFAIIFDSQGRVLLSHRRDMDIWNLPGGGVESGELPNEAVIREVREETGLEAVVERLVGVYGKRNDDLVFSFTCQVTGGQMAYTDESRNCLYFAIDQIPANTSPKHMERIHDALMQTPVPIFTHQTAPSMREYAQSMQAVPLNDQRRLYSDLAWAWPVISEREDCVREADLFVRSIRQVAPAPVSSLLHLGCGGGHLDFSFKEHFSVTGVDLSPAMLRIAGELNPEVVYLPGDMRSVRLEQTFDAVVIADSIDYMLTEQEMLAAFRTAFVHLKPGGIFCTYAGVTCQSFSQNETHVSTSSDGDTEITFIENRYDPDFGDSTYENAFVYLIRRAGQLEVETDRHLGGIFELETWTRLLHDAGFCVHLSRLDESHIHWFICSRLT